MGPVGADHSTESLGMARGPGSSMMVTLFRGAVLLGILLLAISGAASPWGGEDESQLASHQTLVSNNGVHSLMRRGADGEVKKRKSEKKKKKKEGKKEKGIKKKKNRKGKKSKGEKGKGKLKKGKKKKRKNGKTRSGGKSKKKKKKGGKKNKKGKQKNKGKKRNKKNLK